MPIPLILVLNFDYIYIWGMLRHCQLLFFRFSSKSWWYPRKDVFKLFRLVGLGHLTGSESMSDRILCTCEKQSRRNNKAYCMVVHTGDGNFELVVLSQLEKLIAVKLKSNTECCTHYFDCKMNSKLMFLESPYSVCVPHFISIYQLAFSSIRYKKTPPKVFF